MSIGLVAAMGSVGVAAFLRLVSDSEDWLLGVGLVEWLVSELDGLVRSGSSLKAAVKFMLGEAVGLGVTLSLWVCVSPDRD